VTGSVQIEYEIIAATIDASGTVVAHVDAVADPLGLNPILRDLGLGVDYFRLIRVLTARDLAGAVDWSSMQTVNRRRDNAAAVDAVGADVGLSRRDAVASTDAFSLAFVRRSMAVAVDWTRQRVSAVRIDAAVAVEMLALAASRSRRDPAASHDFGQVVLQNYALGYADDYVGDATSF